MTSFAQHLFSSKKADWATVQTVTKKVHYKGIWPNIVIDFNLRHFFNNVFNFESFLDALNVNILPIDYKYSEIIYDTGKVYKRNDKSKGWIKGEKILERRLGIEYTYGNPFTKPDFLEGYCYQQIKDFVTANINNNKVKVYHRIVGFKHPHNHVELTPNPYIPDLIPVSCFTVNNLASTHGYYMFELFDKANYNINNFKIRTLPDGYDFKDYLGKSTFMIYNATTKDQYKKKFPQYLETYAYSSDYLCVVKKELIQRGLIKYFEPTNTWHWIYRSEDPLDCIQKISDIKISMTFAPNKKNKNNKK
jgi:hypothetical protein